MKKMKSTLMFLVVLLMSIFISTQELSAQVCGDAIIDPGEECDRGNYLDPNTATVGIFRYFDDPTLIRE